jgi:amino acid transporter
MKLLRNIIIAAAICFTAFIGYGAYLLSTPDGQARSAERDLITDCRKSFERMPNATVNALCLRLEADFRHKWNREP